MKIQILKCGDKYAVIYKEGWFRPWLYVTQYFDDTFHLQKKRDVIQWGTSCEHAEKTMNNFIQHLKKTHAKIEIVKSVKL